MPNLLDGDLDRRALALDLREADLNRRDARARRDAQERDEQLNGRELQLNRRETALAALAGELAAERERLGALRADMLRELRRLEQRRLQASPRWFAAPEVEESPHEGDWWAKVLGRETPAA